MKTIKEILENPPTKKVKCPRCDGSGIVNRRGMVSSDPCPDCDMGGYYSKSGKKSVTDFKKTEKLIREFIKKETRNANL